MNTVNKVKRKTTEWKKIFVKCKTQKQPDFFKEALQSGKKVGLQL